MTPHILAARSPLDGVTLADGIVELPFVTQVNLRANPGDVDTLVRIGAALGVLPTTTPNTFSSSPDGQRHAVWLGPNEWLIVGAPGTATTIEVVLRDISASDGAVSFVDVSASRTTLSISGIEACAALERNCLIDLHPSRFVAGSCAQTIFARVNVILLKMSDEPEYRLLVRSSLAAHLASWFADAIEI
jgi:sarcosine oxidase, subunit gamma